MKTTIPNNMLSNVIEIMEFVSADMLDLLHNQGESPQFMFNVFNFTFVSLQQQYSKMTFANKPYYMNILGNLSEKLNKTIVLQESTNQQS